MALLERIRFAAAAFRSWPNISISDLDRMIELGDLGEPSSSGIRVNEKNGSQHATVYACINILSRDMASLPLKLYERKANGGRAEVSSHPLSAWLKEPNRVQTPVQYRQHRWAMILTAGDAFSQVLRNPLNEFETWPLEPALVEVKRRKDGTKLYEYKRGAEAREFRQDQVHHSFGLSFDGYRGVSPIRWCMETIGRAIAVGEYGAAYFRNPTPKVILTQPAGAMKPEGREEFIKSWNEKFSGKKGLSTVALLPGGIDVSQIVKIPNNEAQFLETQKFSKEEIAQIYNVPLHRLQALDRATFSNIEHQDLEYVKYTLLPWLTAEEQSIERQFLTRAERERFFVRHSVDALLRGDFKTRMEGHAMSLQWALMTPNEARALENLPAVDGGDDLLIPLNQTKLKDLIPPDQPQGQPPTNQNDNSTGNQGRALNLRAGVSGAEYRSAQMRRRIMQRHRPRFQRAIQGLVADEIRAIEAQAALRLTSTRGTGDFLSWLEDYASERIAAVKQALSGPALAAAKDAATDAANEVGSQIEDERISRFVDEYAQTFAEAWTGKTKAQLSNVVRDAQRDGDDIADAVSQRLSEWNETRAEKQAQRESTALVNGIAAIIFWALGRSLVWVTFGENCPYCDSLRGKRVAPNEAFVPEGDYQPEGAQTPLKIRGIRKHPPIHSGCDCSIAPG